MIPYDETHQAGYLSVEQDLKRGIKECHVGVQIAEDGRIWICVNGVALLRFKPASEKFMKYMRQQMQEQPEKITNKDKILEICRTYMNKKGKAPFLYALYIKSQYLIVEGPGVLGINTTPDEVKINLTNSDSNYQASIGMINLDDIGYIQEVRM